MSLPYNGTSMFRSNAHVLHFLCASPVHIRLISGACYTVSVSAQGPPVAVQMITASISRRHSHLKNTSSFMSSLACSYDESKTLHGKK
mmetsp:Transcript_3788/g.6774  ORF Transcript_3788/g.6774 Transcript_3788/m.6774 type:complete len:88 (+) Transcript_3788:45-308(+)